MLYPDIPELSKQQLSDLCEEFRRHNFINPEISEKLGVKRGLRNSDGTGVLAGLTNICDVVGYDKDENGWIDEADEIFQKLRIWTKDENGNDKLLTLSEAGVGAIYLGYENTDFS